MNIDYLKLGELETNCYILTKENKVLIIDPADNFIRIKNRVNNFEVVGVIVTHKHPDHIGALEEVLSYYKTKLYDINNLKEGKNKIDDFTFEVLYTKGHTDDSITIYFEKEKAMFTGDFLFYLSIGRTDLGGNYLDMKNSIEKIKTYKDINIYPGHGPFTTIDFEKENNPFFNNKIHF